MILYLKGLTDIGNGDGENGVSYRDLHSIYDSQSQRDFQGNGGAMAGLAGNSDGSAYGFHIFLYNVHSHPAAGVFGYLLVGGKARKHDKPKGFLAAIFALRLGEKPFFPRFLKQTVVIHAVAVEIGRASCRERVSSPV